METPGGDITRGPCPAAIGYNPPMSRTRRSRTLVSLTFGAGVLGLAIVLAAPVARACGMFLRVREVSPEQRPSLAREKVLIIHDAARGQQHFIREVAFRRADQSFGFVVPTPTRPEVATVEKNPFTKLRERFPFATVNSDARTGRGFGGTGGGSGGSVGVEVLAVEKVGSFTAFTLAATDADALASWLKDNQLASTPATERWLAHYVRMGFYYVAMRYDPPERARASAPVAAETVRISFASPLAYYPYFEPEPDAPTKGPRLLELWYVGTEPVVPVARFASAGSESSQWVRPLAPGKDRTDARGAIEAALYDELEQLLPEGELVVQTFQDQKIGRSGYHDILFGSAAARPLTPEQQTALAPLLGVLDPGLIEEKR